MQGRLTNSWTCVKSLCRRQLPSLACIRLQSSLPSLWDSWGNFNYLSSGISGIVANSTEDKCLFDGCPLQPHESPRDQKPKMLTDGSSSSVEVHNAQSWLHSSSEWAFLSLSCHSWAKEIWPPGQPSPMATALAFTFSPWNLLLTQVE